MFVLICPTLFSLAFGPPQLVGVTGEWRLMTGDDEGREMAGEKKYSFNRDNTTMIVQIGRPNFVAANVQQSFYDVLKSKFSSQWRPLSKLDPAHVPPMPYAD